MNFEDTRAVVTIIIAAFTTAWSIRETMRAKRLSNIRDLLGEKETVAFAAVQMLRSPKIGQRQGFGRVLDTIGDSLRRLFRRPPRDYTSLFDAIICACVFESSDRARALLYDVLYKNLDLHRQEIESSYKRIRDVFEKTERYELSPIRNSGKRRGAEEFELATGLGRLEWVRKVLDYQPRSVTDPASGPSTMLMTQPVQADISVPSAADHTNLHSADR